MGNFFMGKQPSMQDLDAQIADLQNRGRVSAAGDVREELSRLMNQRNSMAANQPAALSPEQQQMNAAREKIRELTEGRSNELRNDSVLGSSQKFLQGVLGGKETPFNSEVQNSMLAQNAKGSAAAEQAQMQALREAIEASGGSVYDPSFRAKQAELMANRQGANLDAQGQLGAQANLANFDAKAGAANSLAGQRLGQNAQINQMNLAGAGYRAQEAQPVNQRPLQQQAAGVFAPLILGAQPQQHSQQPAAPGYVYQPPVPGTRQGVHANYASPWLANKPKPQQPANDPYAGYL